MRTQSSTRLALLGGKAEGSIRTPQFPRFSRLAIRRVVKLLEAGRTVALNTRWSGELRDAAAAVSRYHGGRHVLCVGSGHAALHSALAGLEIGPGDEVITTPYTWGASISCILHQSAIPVFGDVDPVTGLLDPATIEPLITRRTRAILVVHLYGQPADMTAIMRIARKRGLAVIEDGSQAHGARWKGEVVGNFGDAGGFSCMGGKLLATSEAGYMVTPRKDVYWRSGFLGQHMCLKAEKGFPAKLTSYVDSLIYTYRMSPITAVLLEEQLKTLNADVKNRRRNVDHVRNLMKDCRFIQFPDYGTDSRPSYHMVTMNFLAEEAGVSRDTFVSALRAEGLGAFHYIPSPIPAWRRMNWRGYKGPRTTWLDSLRRAGVDYAKVGVPNCRYKVDHAIEMGFNYYKPAKNAMVRIAGIFHKVEENIEALRKHEKARKSRAR